MSTNVDSIADIFEIEATTTKSSISKEKIVNEFARITQYLTWPLLFILFHLFFNINIQGRKNFKNIRSPFVIISNHIAYYDSFFFRLVFGPITPNLPLRFMAVKKFESKTMNCLANFGVVDFVYSLFGVFTVVPGLGIEKNIEKAKEIVKIGGNIVIYPEGRVMRTSNEIGPFKNGAAVLRQTTGVSIIPVSFRITGHGLLRRRIRINVGEELVIQENQSTEEMTEFFRAAVVSLYENK
jgi:1-acyl-sn-glycerol-3-phosphate acyltransferase